MPRLVRFSLLPLLLAGLSGTGCGPGSTNGTGVDGDGGSSANSGSGGNGNGSGLSGGGGTVPVNFCGDGVLNAMDECDDANRIGGDGCSSECKIEPGAVCPVPGQPCTAGAAVCGDGVVSRTEACDEGAMRSGGCSEDCKMVTMGWQCRVPGKPCVPACGDGMVIETETCDPPSPGMGCSPSCLTEPGWTCMGAPSVCTPSVCGNGTMEPGESCDAGPLNGLFLGDGSGCSKTCTQEPICRSGTGAMTTRACDVSCGNGHMETGEDCDDGNLLNGDGCSMSCTNEVGFMCTTEMRPDTEACTDSGTAGQCLRLPIVLRDFKSERETGGHPDFFFHGAPVATPVSIPGVTGQANPFNFNRRYCIPNTSGTAKQQDASVRSWDLATASLDPAGKPVFNAARPGGTMTDCQFTDWSHDTNGAHVPGYVNETHGPLGSGGFAYVAGPNGHPQYKGRAPIVASAQSFGQWWVDGPPTNNTHSVVTLELAAQAAGLYQYSSASHSIYGGFFPLDPPANMFPLYSPTGSMAGPGTVRTSTSGNNEPLLCNDWPYWYSSATFGAGANCRARQYILPPTASPANCFITDANNTSWRAGCWAGTTAQDQEVQGWFHNQWFTTEARYLFAFNGAFSLAFYGDDDLFIYINGMLVIDLGGVHQRLPGRVDVDAAGSATIIEGGSADPVTGAINPCPGIDPFTMQPVVVGADCRTRTVNLGLEAGRTYEIAIFHADRGATESNYQLTLSGFSTTRSLCTPRCGDAIRTGGEECDCGDPGTMAPTDCGGMNNADGTYGGCTSTCEWGPFCGDMTVDAQYEQCDNGPANGASYGAKGACTAACVLAPFCGDEIVDVPFEECDLGENTNGAMGSSCDGVCKLIPL
jgi:fibro-slime domain-containing protein